MKKGLFILMFVFCTGISARAQSFSVEVGTGIPSLFTAFFTFNGEDSFYGHGQQPEYKWTLTTDVSAVWRTTSRWEVVLSCGYSQRLYKVTQYPEFGTDPYGQPRYDFSKPGQPLGTKGLKPVETLCLQGRYIWLEEDGLEEDENLSFYTAVCVGVMTDLNRTIPVAGLTPFAFRISGTHFYFFAEVTVSPLATIGHGGFGWRF